MYPIQSVEETIRVPAATLRYWEKTYGLVSPQRTEGDHRLYSQENSAVPRAVIDAALARVPPVCPIRSQTALDTGRDGLRRPVRGYVRTTRHQLGDAHMEELEGSIFDGKTIVLSGTTVLLDVLDALAGSADGTGWHAHAALPLGVVVEPGQQMRLETADGRSGPVALLDVPKTEGDRVLHVLTGLGPLVR